MIPGVTLDDTSEITADELHEIRARCAATRFTSQPLSSTAGNALSWSHGDSGAQAASDRARLLRLLNSTRVLP